MAPEFAVRLIDPETSSKAEIGRRAAEYRQEFAAVSQAKSRGYIDEVIEPQSTRLRLCKALARLHKRLEDPWRKHSNIPL